MVDKNHLAGGHPLIGSPSTVVKHGRQPLPPHRDKKMEPSGRIHMMGNRKTIMSSNTGLLKKKWDPGRSRS